MTNEGIAKKLFKKLYFIEEHDIEILAEALRQKEIECYEKAAQLVESHDEVNLLSNGRWYLNKKTSNNVNGNAYAEAIRALKPTDKEQPK